MADEKEKTTDKLLRDGGRLAEFLQSLGISALVIERVADLFKRTTAAHKSIKDVYDGFREIRGQFTRETDDEIIFHYAKNFLVEELGDEGRRMVEVVNNWLMHCLTKSQRDQFTQLIGGSFVDQLVLFSEYYHQKNKEGQQSQQQQSTSQVTVVPQVADPDYKEALLKKLTNRAVEIVKEYAGYADDVERTQALIAAHIISGDKIQRREVLSGEVQQFVAESEDALVRARQRYEESKRRRR